MLLLGIDLETGGSFDAPKEDNFITEIGACLWDTNHGPVKMFSEILNLGKPICKEAEEYTGITDRMKLDYGINEMIHPQIFRTKTQELFYFMTKADYIVAHNGLEFDKPILMQFLKSIGIQMPDKTWIDTMIDVPYPKNCTSRSLTYLAGHHLILNCFPHRAITDVLTMMTILMKYDLSEVIKCAETPIIEAVWSSPYPSKHKFRGDSKAYLLAMKEFTENKSLASKHRFRWNPENKEWVLKTRKHLIPDIELPLTIRELQHGQTEEDS